MSLGAVSFFASEDGVRLAGSIVLCGSVQSEEFERRRSILIRDVGAEDVVMSIAHVVGRVTDRFHLLSLIF